MKEHHNLSTIDKNQIQQLINQGCTCQDWKKFKIHQNCNLSKIINSHFEGNVQIIAKFKNDKGPEIFNCEIKNVQLIGDSLLKNISLLSDTIIMNNCEIVNVQEISYSSHRDELDFNSSHPFGEGININLLNTVKGNKVPLSSNFNANSLEKFVYIDNLSQKKAWLKKYHLNQKKINKNHLGPYSVIKNCNSITNVHFKGFITIKNGVVIDQCTQLGRDVTVSNMVYIKQAILASKSKITNQSNVQKSFIGENVKVADGALIASSYLFSNSSIALSEVVGSICGPFAISHHRATLLISGRFSYFNAGSGTNFSNHNYRLGPIHCGFTERGVKMGSDSYILHPCHIGMHTTVIGRHKQHPDTRAFPLSILFENNKKSELIPAYDVYNIGIQRDNHKWKARSKRELKADFIHSEIYNPLLLERIYCATEYLKKSLKIDANFIGPGFTIRKENIPRAIQRYQLLIKFILIRFSQRLVKNKINFYHLFEKSLKETTLKSNLKEHFNDTWVDLGGMIYPKSIFSQKKNFTSYHNQDLHQEKWGIKTFGFVFSEFFASKKKLIYQMHAIIDRYIDSLAGDCAREFRKKKQVGYNPYLLNAKNFSEVQGTSSTNQFYKDLRAEFDEIKDNLK